jgi:hypothetical protein
LADEIKKNEMGGTRGTYGREDRYIQGFGGESLGKETTYNTRHRQEYNIKMDLQEVGWGYGTTSTWFRKGTGSFECGNELWDSIKYGEFFDQQKTCLILKKDSAPLS